MLLTTLANPVWALGRPNSICFAIICHSVSKIIIVIGVKGLKVGVKGLKVGDRHTGGKLEMMLTAEELA